MDEKTHCDKIQSLLDDVKSGHADDYSYLALEDSCRDLFIDHLEQKGMLYEPCAICGKTAQHSLTLFNFEGGGTYRYPLCHSDYIRMYHELRKSVAWAYAQEQATECKEEESE